LFGQLVDGGAEDADRGAVSARAVGCQHVFAIRVAALYDIRANLSALDAMVGDAEQACVDRIVVGGDVVPGPLSVETIGRLRALGAWAVFRARKRLGGGGVGRVGPVTVRVRPPCLGADSPASAKASGRGRDGRADD
jgi:hypothetical protein